MAGEEASQRQDDIEDLLRQAQMAAGMAPEAAQDEAALENLQPLAAVGAALATAARPVAAPRHSASAVAEMSPSSGGINDDIQMLLAQAEQAIASVDQPTDPGIPGLAPFALRDLAGAPASGDRASLELLSDVDLDLRIELGRTQMFLEDVLKLKRGSVVALDKLAGDPVDVFVNGRMVARGEVLVLNDNFCVRVTELVSGDDFE
jgi:flagellar motor switch protein FliN/FliY